GRAETGRARGRPSTRGGTGAQARPGESVRNELAGAGDGTVRRCPGSKRGRNDPRESPAAAGGRGRAAPAGPCIDETDRPAPTRTPETGPVVDAPARLAAPRARPLARVHPAPGPRLPRIRLVPALLALLVPLRGAGVEVSDPGLRRLARLPRRGSRRRDGHTA